MLILSSHGQAETKVKNSRFLAEIFPVHTPEEAKKFGLIDHVVTSRGELNK